MKRAITTMFVAVAVALAGLAGVANASELKFTNDLGTAIGARAVVGFTCYTTNNTAVYRADYIHTDEYTTTRQHVQFRTRYERLIGTQWFQVGLILNWQSVEIGGYYNLPIPRGTGQYRLFTQYAYWNFSQNAWTLTGWYPETFNKITPTFSMWSNYCTA